MLEDYCFDRDRLGDRLAHLCHAVANEIFGEGVPDEAAHSLRTFHRSGTALYLYTRWLLLMDELNVPEHERWTDNALARPISDTLMALDFPMDVRGCEVLRDDYVGGYEIRSKGRLGGVHWMRFVLSAMRQRSWSM